jgi:hypothetical protein
MRAKTVLGLERLAFCRDQNGLPSRPTPDLIRRYYIWQTHTMPLDDFESVARRLECDQDKERFEKNLGKIAKAKTKPARADNH